jgi:aminopeptidase-like protein
MSSTAPVAEAQTPGIDGELLGGPVELEHVGGEMHALMARLYPICRSITGEGLRETLRILGEYVPLTIREVPTGTRVFDWTIPREWNIQGAYIKTATGEKVVDFSDSNLHVVNYSIPIHRRMPLRELREHLHSLPQHPEWIPYLTTYYQENWGFCLRHSQLLQLRDEEYEVCIDSSLREGALSFGELLLRGASEEEVLISTHVCHPSLCNDNLSGVTLATFLAKRLMGLSLRYSYRFLFLPGTIGAITWLSLNESRVSAIRHGLVVTCVGDGGHFTYKRSRRGDAEIDRVAAYVLRTSGRDYEIVDFSPDGYDERQYCSPGFNLPVGVLTRTPHGRFPEYHTSADDLSFVQPVNLAESLLVYSAVVTILERNRTYLNTSPKGEPQLGRRGLYHTMGGRVDRALEELALLWVLNLSDGYHSLLDIAERSALPFGVVKRAADTLTAAGLLREER